MRKNSRVPVNVGDRLNLVCEGVGDMGDGIFRLDGYVIFASGVDVGRKYVLEVSKALPRVAFADVVR